MLLDTVTTATKDGYYAGVEERQYNHKSDYPVHIPIVYRSSVALTDAYVAGYRAALTTEV